MSIGVYVISLEDEIERRNRIILQLKEPFFFIDAIDMRQMDENNMVQYINRDALKYPKVRNTITRGEVGCSLSHLKALDKFVQDGYEYALIIEDDALLPSNYLELITDICEKITIPWDVILLGYSKLKFSEATNFYKMEPILVEQKINIFELGKPWRNWTSGTVSYLINKNAAKRFIKKHNGKVFTVADDWDYFKNNFELDILHCRPLIVFEDFDNLKSSIESERGTYIAKESTILIFFRILRGYIRKLILTIRGL